MVGGCSALEGKKTDGESALQDRKGGGERPGKSEWNRFERQQERKSQNETILKDKQRTR